jgi:hypothetical protein
MIEDNTSDDTKGTKQRANKAKQGKPQSFRQRWKATAVHNKIMAIATAGGMAFAGVYAGSYVIGLIIDSIRYKKEHRATVINNRPPEFLQPFTCDLKRVGGSFTTGNMRLFLKNVGDVRVDRSFPIFVMKIIPEKKTGNASVDNPPPANCASKPREIPAMLSLIPNKETSMDIRQSVMTTPPSLTDGDVVQLYAVSCIAYVEQFGPTRSVCDSYRLMLPSTNPLDRLNGSPSFTCDAKPKIGRFMEELSGHCAE